MFEPDYDEPEADNDASAELVVTGVPEVFHEGRYIVVVFGTLRILMEADDATAMAEAIQEL